MKDPLLPPLVFFIAGLLLARAARFELLEISIALALVLALAVAAYLWARRLAYSCVLIAVCIVGIGISALHRLKSTPTIDASAQELVLLNGCVIEPPILYQDRDQFTLELAPNASARVSLTLREGQPPPDLRYGQLVEVEAKIRPVRNFHNPGSVDFEEFSARRKIFWTASVPPDTPVKVLPGRCGSRFFAAIFGLRTAALNRIDSLYPNDPYATGMMEAILIGETAKLEKVWTEQFRRTGTFHALVISGMHVTVLAGTLLFLMRLCFLPEFPSLAATAFAAWVYALISGWSAPVVRAAGAFTLYLVGRYFYRQRRLMNLVAAVAIGYLIYDPGQLFDSSFQLSFLSVVAIGALAVPLIEATSARYSRAVRHLNEKSFDWRLEPRGAQFRVELRLIAETLSYYLGFATGRFEQALGWLARLGLYIYDMMVISAVIQIGLALPMAIYFHRISFTGLSANLIIVPLLSLVVPIGFIAIFTNWHWLAVTAELLLKLAARTADWHVRWEPDNRIPDPPVWLALAFAASLFAMILVLQRSWRWKIPAVAAVFGLFALLFLHPFPPRVKLRQLELSVLDVGQGDALLVAFPDGKLMMVDGGGFPNLAGRKTKPKLDIGEDVVSPYLWSRSITRLDVIVCTHAHEDHAGGIPALIDNFHPSALWTGANGESPVWRELRAKAKSRGVPIESMLAGRSFDYGGVRIDVLAPLADYEASDIGKNNDSLVLRLTYGSRSFLLTGDMEKQVETELWVNGALARADVLKVPHHGSNTSSTDLLLDAVRPEFAIISDGFENSFHHPHKNVLARLAAHHAAILRTDQAGLVTIRTDGTHLSYSTAATQ